MTIRKTNLNQRPMIRTESRVSILLRPIQQIADAVEAVSIFQNYFAKFFAFFTQV